MSISKRSSDFLTVAAVAITSLALLVDLPTPLPLLSAFLLLLVWPTLAWSKRQTGSFLECLFLGGAIALTLNALLILLLIYLPGPVPRTWQIVLHAVVCLLPVILVPRGSKLAEASGREVPWELVLVLFAVLSMRLPSLGYSEFQGDEGVIMVRAAAIITGDDTELFLHQKGPIEILFPLGMWNLSNVINEFWARLPFVWASGLAIMAVIALGRRWFGRYVGWMAGLLFALAGFPVAFGRIVQYQSFVMMWATAAVFSAVRYRQEGRRPDLLLAVVFLASGLLAHYDAVLVAPAVAWAILSRFRQGRNVDWFTLASATSLGMLILSIFYVPFALNPSFARTGRYLLQARLGADQGSGLLSWSGPAVWQMVTFYNSTYYTVFLIALIFVVLVKLFRQRSSLDTVLFVLAPLLFYLFIVKDPRTHVYTIYPGATVLAAAGAIYLVNLLGRAGNRYVLYASIIACLLVLLLSGYYVFLLFIDHTPERQRTWTENRPPAFPATWEEPPLYGLFGFPHQAGWRAIGEFLPESAYPYASNEEEEITNWYMSQAPRTHCANFQTFVLAENVQDQIPYEHAWLESSNLQYRVVIDGRSSMRIYSRTPVSAAQTIDAADSQHWVAPDDVAPPIAGGEFPINLVLGEEQVKLLGYDLDASAAHPGGQVVVTLFWQALAPFDRNYQTFVHLVGDELLAQHDGAPECDINPTTRWEPGQTIPDPHIVPIDGGIEGGRAKLYAGMYDLLTHQPMVSSSADDHGIYLKELSIEGAGQ